MANVSARVRAAQQALTRAGMGDERATWDLVRYIGDGLDALAPEPGRSASPAEAARLWATRQRITAVLKWLYERSAAADGPLPADWWPADLPPLPDTLRLLLEALAASTQEEAAEE